MCIYIYIYIDIYIYTNICIYLKAALCPLLILFWRFLFQVTSEEAKDSWENQFTFSFKKCSHANW